MAGTEKARVLIIFPDEPLEHGEKLIDFVAGNAEHIAEVLRNALFWPTWLDFEIAGELEG